MLPPAFLYETLELLTNWLWCSPLYCIKRRQQAALHCNLFDSHKRQVFLGYYYADSLQHSSIHVHVCIVSQARLSLGRGRGAWESGLRDYMYVYYVHSYVHMCARALAPPFLYFHSDYCACPEHRAPPLLWLHSAEAHHGMWRSVDLDGCDRWLWQSEKSRVKTDLHPRLGTLCRVDSV